MDARLAVVDTLPAGGVVQIVSNLVFCFIGLNVSKEIDGCIVVVWSAFHKYRWRAVERCEFSEAVESVVELPPSGE